MVKKDKNNKISLELWTPIILGAFTLFLWDYPIVFPFKLFIVLLHEISHVIVAIVTGGTPSKIILGADLSGLTVINGGSSIFIASAGYLGSLCWGIVLFVAAKKNNLRKMITLILSIIIIISSINLVEGGIQVFLGLVVSLLLFATPRYFSDNITVFSLRFLGITSCFYVIADIKQDLLTTTFRETDTQIIEYFTGIPAIYIGILWLVLSITLVFFAIKFEQNKSK